MNIFYDAEFEDMPQEQVISDEFSAYENIPKPSRREFTQEEKDVWIKGHWQEIQRQNPRWLVELWRKDFLYLSLE